MKTLTMPRGAMTTTTPRSLPAPDETHKEAPNGSEEARRYLRAERITFAVLAVLLVCLFASTSAWHARHVPDNAPATDALPYGWPI